MARLEPKTKPDANLREKVPNGGSIAWWQVAGCFFLFFNAWLTSQCRGVINTYGVYQTIYELTLLHSSSPSTIAWIGSTQTFMLMFGGTLSGPIYDAGYFYALMFGGSFLVVFGHMMLSLCEVYWQVLLAQAFCIGIGTGCLYVPGLAILSTYFDTRLVMVNGFAAAGASLGGVIYPIVLYRLHNSIGLPWAVRIIGFIALGTLFVPCLCMRVRVSPARTRPLLDWSAFRDAPFMLFSWGGFVGFMGLYVFFFYLQPYALQRDIDETVGFYLIAILNAASIFGRILPNLVADKVGPLNIIIPCSLAAGILQICLIPVSSTASIVVVTAFFGFCSGTFVSLPGAIVVRLTQNRGLIGTRIGMSFALYAIGILIGPPIAGAILDSSKFAYVWVFGGVATLCGSLFFVVARGIAQGWNVRIRA